MFNRKTAGKIGVGGLLALVSTFLFALGWTPVKQHQTQPSALSAEHLPYGHYKKIYPVGNCLVTIHHGEDRQVVDTQETVMTLERDRLHFKFPNVQFKDFEVYGTVLPIGNLLPRESSPISLTSNLPMRLRFLQSLNGKQVTLRDIHIIEDHYLQAEEREGCTYFFQDPKSLSAILASQGQTSSKTLFDFLPSRDSGEATDHLADKINLLMNLKVDDQGYYLKTDLRFFIGGLFCLGLAIFYFIPIRYGLGLVFIPAIVQGLWLLSPVSVLTGILGLVSFPLIAHLGNRFLLTVFVTGLLLFVANILFGTFRVSIDQVVNLLLFLVIATLLTNLWTRRT